MSAKQIEKWERTRAKGFKRFLWVNGFLGWGVTTGAFWWLSMAFFQPTYRSTNSLLLALVVFPIGGLVWGWWVWRAMEKKYHAAKAQRGS